MSKVYTSLKSLSSDLKSEVKHYNDQTINTEATDIQAQGRMLLGDLNALWSGYEASYTPSVYRRSGATKAGFKLSEPRVTGVGVNTKVEIDLIMDAAYIWHDSLFGGNRAHSFMSISEGWHAPGLEAYMGREIYRLTKFDGIGIIQSLINSYNNDKVQFKFYHEGNEYA